MVHPNGIEYGIRKAVQHNTAMHNPRHPAHATVMLMQLIGELDAIANRKDKDAMLQAVMIQEAMPRLMGYMYKLNNWTKAVANMAPDGASEYGADSCL